MNRQFFIVALLLTLPVMADWQVPTNPDARAIIDEAFADRRAGRYEESLAKHLWFHTYALEHDPKLVGVRLAPALMGWHDLGIVYPPALKKLREIRDEAARQVFNRKENARAAFGDMSAINEELEEEELTRDTFIRLDREYPEVAREVYDKAQPSLLKAKRFELCGKYLQPRQSYAEMVELYGLDLRFAEEEKSLTSKNLERKRAESTFLNRAATLIALLVLNDRKPEAEKIAADAVRELKRSTNDKVIDAALEGKPPTRLTEKINRLEPETRSD